MEIASIQEHHGVLRSRLITFTAKDITFQNDAGFNAGQAVAVESDGDKMDI
jgi:hypothetical protein